MEIIWRVVIVTNVMGLPLTLRLAKEGFRGGNPRGWVYAGVAFCNAFTLVVYVVTGR